MPQKYFLTVHIANHHDWCESVAA